jgi:hypothetical protein
MLNSQIEAGFALVVLEKNFYAIALRRKEPDEPVIIIMISSIFLPGVSKRSDRKSD